MRGLKIKLKEKTPFRGGRSLPIVGLVAVVGVGVAMFVSAAGAFTAVELENGTLSGGAAAVSLSGASGGKVVQFGSGATPTPTPTPAPTPTPTQTPGTGSCALPKYPTPSCTGVPAGTALTVTTGDITLSAGQVLNGRQVNGNVFIAGNGVVIKNSAIFGTVRGSQTNPPSFTITDSRITSLTSACNGDAALAFANYTATRVRIDNFGDGPRDSGNNILIQDSFIKTCSNPGDHADGFQGYLGGTNVRVIHNTIDVRASHPDVTAPLFAADGSAGILAQDNLVAGGSFSIRLYGSGFTVTGNKIVNNAWMYGPVASDCGGGNAWSNNSLVNIDTNYNITSTVGPQACVQG